MSSSTRAPEPSVLIGDLRHRVEVQLPLVTADSAGEKVTTWVTFATRWAAIEQLAGKKLFVAQQLYPEANTLITMRYFQSLDGGPIDTNWRLRWAGRAFEIVAIDDIEERHRKIELTCIERLAERAT